MFNNIGDKIENLAIALCVLGMVASISAGLLLVGGETGIIYAILGSIISWVANMALYGFGHLIEKTDETYDKINEFSRNMQALFAQQNNLLRAIIEQNKESDQE